MSYYTTPEGKDPQLWHIARKRAAFKRHLVTYIAVNIGLWLLWYLTGAKNSGNSLIPWPAWTTFGWGVGLVAHYLGAYVASGNSVEKEYDKLTQKQTK